ncbi:hypothetical protein ACFQ7A_30750 [Streptomyces sp. NPDC056528]|uniref:hypothetical protein n=1 Tax=Streptomyces sp. NPDC056528 TaxID=3345854 RepID=UPI00367CE21F
MTTLGVAVTALSAGLAGAAPAAAGGIGDFISPAFGTSCANLNNGTRAEGVTRHATGTIGGNVAGLPLGSPLNQCGGADMPIADMADSSWSAVPVLLRPNSAGYIKPM